MTATRHACLMMLIATALVAAGCNSAPSVPDTPDDQFVPLFNGKDLTGWQVVGGDAAFRVEDGEIVGTCKNATANTFLRTEKTYRDFEFRCQFKWDTPGNSGIQFRSHQFPSTHETKANQVYGYQYELDSSPRRWSGGLYEENRRRWDKLWDGRVYMDGEENLAKRQAVRYDDWNDVVIQCKGNRIRTWLNGVSIVDYEDLDGEYPLLEGFFALQVHAGGSGQFRWRDLRIKELEQ